MIVAPRKLISHVSGEVLETSPWLTIGKEYVVMALFFSNQEISMYFQSDSDGQPGFFLVRGFEFVSQKIPSTWVTKIKELNGKKVVKMLPASWAYDGFFEDITEEEPKAVSLFWKEARIIYAEEGYQIED